jgi:DNA-binding NarL/FixJ family response regulator
MAEKLTSREIEILMLRVAGYTRTGIAKELEITLSTVKIHLENIHRKLGVNGQISLVQKSL